MAATSRICSFYPRLRTKNCHTRDVWNRLLQQLKPLAAELVADNHAHASLAECVEKMLVGGRRLGAEERDAGGCDPSDKVMQIENDYDKEVYNGDIGYIDDVDPNAGEIVASFDGRSVTYGFGELDMLVPAYATTIHKSQGSEYPAVIIPVLTQHYAMLQRNLLYTGVTRGKQLVVLVGQKQAIAIAVRNVSGRRRWSKLGEQLAPKTL